MRPHHHNPKTMLLTGTPSSGIILLGDKVGPGAFADQDEGLAAGCWVLAKALTQTRAALTIDTCMSAHICTQSQRAQVSIHRFKLAGLQIMNNEFGGGQIFHVSQPWVGYPGLLGDGNCTVWCKHE